MTLPNVLTRSQTIVWAVAPERPYRPASILEQIGNTPLLDLSDLVGKPGVELYAKAEWFNPGGSVKDRAALRIIEDAEQDGRLTHDRVLIDATSGNTGIGYAMIGAAKGYAVRLVMPANVTQERKALAKAYGATIVESDPLEGSDGAIRLARQIVADEPERYFYPDQYNNDSNWRAHYDTTGPEILCQTNGRVTHFVAGLGTTGTFMGVGRRLKEPTRPSSSWPCSRPTSCRSSRASSTCPPPWFPASTTRAWPTGCCPSRPRTPGRWPAGWRARPASSSASAPARPSMAQCRSLRSWTPAWSLPCCRTAARST